MPRKFFLLILFTCSFLHSQVQVRGGELFSKDQQLYGRYEVRMRTAQGSGILSTFFTFENDSWMTGTGNPWRELDVEVLGRYTDRFQTNIITGTADGRITSEFYPTIGVNPAESYNTYAIEWTPDYIAFLFNGQEVRKTNAGDALGQVAACRNIPQSYRFNLWANAISAWVGPFNASILPKYQFVNWIKYYSYNTGTKQFSLAWQDNFDSFDSQRWGRADWSIENFTQFHASNVIVKDGALVLALTDMQGSGLNNIVVPPDQSVGMIDRKSRSANSISLASDAKRVSGAINVSYSLETAGYAGVTVMDLKGKVVAERFENFKDKGTHETSFALNKGVYLVRVRAGEQADMHRVVCF